MHIAPSHPVSGRHLQDQPPALWEGGAEKLLSLGPLRCDGCYGDMATQSPGTTRCGFWENTPHTEFPLQP